MNKLMEQVGQVAGERIGVPVLEYLRGKMERFEVTLSGQENLQSLRGDSFLLVANHLMPEGGTAQQSQLSPDAFVLEWIVRDLNQQELKIVAKADDGWWAGNFYRHFQEHFSQPFGLGMHKGLGFIPVLKNPGSVNRDLVRTVRAIMSDSKNPILIFPEGHWYPDWDPENPLETGAATLALKYDLPILPAYIHGARGWKPGTEVFVSFDEPFEPGKQSKEEITNQIRASFTRQHQDFQLMTS